MNNEYAAKVIDEILDAHRHELLFSRRYALGLAKAALLARAPLPMASPTTPNVAPVAMIESLRDDIVAINAWPNAWPTNYRHDAGWFKILVLKLFADSLAAPASTSADASEEPRNKLMDEIVDLRTQV